MCLRETVGSRCSKRTLRQTAPLLSKDELYARHEPEVGAHERGGGGRGRDTATAAHRARKTFTRPRGCNPDRGRGGSVTTTQVPNVVCLYVSRHVTRSMVRWGELHKACCQGARTPGQFLFGHCPPSPEPTRQKGGCCGRGNSPSPRSHPEHVLTVTQTCDPDRGREGGGVHDALCEATTQRRFLACAPLL